MLRYGIDKKSKNKKVKFGFRIIFLKSQHFPGSKIIIWHGRRSHLFFHPVYVQMDLHILYI